MGKPLVKKIMLFFVSVIFKRGKTISWLIFSRFLYLPMEVFTKVTEPV